MSIYFKTAPVVPAGKVCKAGLAWVTTSHDLALPYICMHVQTVKVRRRNFSKNISIQLRGRSKTIGKTSKHEKKKKKSRITTQHGVGREKTVFLIKLFWLLLRIQRDLKLVNLSLVWLLGASRVLCIKKPTRSGSVRNGSRLT